jgi:hypothetical protein
MSCICIWPICKSHYLLFDDMLFVSNFRVYSYHVLQRHRSPTVVCIRISTTFTPFWRPQRKSTSRTPKYTSSAKPIIVNGDAGRIKGDGFLDCLVDGTPEPRTNQNDGEVESFELERGGRAVEFVGRPVQTKFGARAGRLSDSSWPRHRGVGSEICGGVLDVEEGSGFAHPLVVIC